MKKLSRLNIILPLSLTITFLAIACGNDVEKKGIHKSTLNETKKDTTGNFKKINSNTQKIFVDSFYNTIAQVVGGMDSTLPAFTKKWDRNFIRFYSANSRFKYEKIKNDRLSKIYEWNTGVMKRNGQPDSSFAFYPFSGGDFIHMAWLYPNAQEYYMIAKEPVGDFPDLINSDSITVNQYLKNVDLVLRDIYYRSYFITKNMIIDMKNKNLVNGVLPLIMWGMSKTGHEILEVKFGALSDSGKMEFKNKKEFKVFAADAVEITFRKINTNAMKKLTYLSCDISDPGFTNKPFAFVYLKNRIPDSCMTFIKSASYLLHYHTFQKIRTMIIEKSNYLVQDDTGIPFREFTSGNWNKELYGIYTKPVKDFKTASLYQRDLDSAYRNPKFYKGELNFSLGYHWSSKKQNQMVFKKIKR